MHSEVKIASSGQTAGIPLSKRASNEATLAFTTAAVCLSISANHVPYGLPAPWFRLSELPTAPPILRLTSASSCFAFKARNLSFRAPMTTGRTLLSAFLMRMGRDPTYLPGEGRARS